MALIEVSGDKATVRGRTPLSGAEVTATDLRASASLILAGLVAGPRGWRIIGSLNNYLVHTLNQVMQKRRLTLRELSEEEGIGMNTSGNRLLNLYKKRLVDKVEGMAPGKDEFHRGRQFVYQSLLAS